MIHFYRAADASLYRHDDGALAGERWDAAARCWTWDAAADQLAASSSSLIEMPLLAARAIWRSWGYSTGVLTGL